MVQVGELLIKCEKMAVRNLGWSPWSDRMTDKLVCRGWLTVNGTKFDLTYTFPQCRVTYQSVGSWLVEAFDGEGNLDDGTSLLISWPAEPVIREGRYMMAKPIDSSDGHVLIDGKGYDVKASLPLARGVPQWPFGWFSYLVDAVDVRGKVLQI